MKKVVAIVLMCSACVSCGLFKHTPVIEYRDSVRVEYRDRIIHDTAKFEIPVIVEKNVTRDTSSHLENPYAKSDASVSDGFLSHSLESIPQIIKVPYEVEVHDTLYFEKSSQSEIKEVEVEKPLSWWERLKIGAFPWLLLALLLTNAKTIAKMIVKL